MVKHTHDVMAHTKQNGYREDEDFQVCRTEHGSGSSRATGWGKGGTCSCNNERAGQYKHHHPAPGTESGMSRTRMVSTVENVRSGPPTFVFENASRDTESPSDDAASVASQ